MPVFKLFYRDGSSEEVTTDAVDVADQINRTFGLSPDEAEEFGVSALMMPEDHVMVPGVQQPEEEADEPADDTNTVVSNPVDTPQSATLTDAEGNAVVNPFAPPTEPDRTVEIQRSVEESSEPGDNT
jgi:hypothetical protein